MKKRQFIACLLMLFSMVLVVAPTIAHHHHHSAKMCMKQDYCNCDDSQQGDHQHHDDYACHNNCMAKFVLLQPQSAVSMDELSDMLPVLLLPYDILSTDCLHIPLLTLLRQLKIPNSTDEYCAYTVRATGLRAPPAIA